MADLPNLKKLETIFTKVGQALVDENLSPREALIVASAIAQSLFEVMVNNPESFAKNQLKEILGLREDVK